jgi:hypothetical protein
VIHRPSPGALLLACLLIAAIACAPSPARATEDEPHGGGALAGVGAMLCTLVYSPLKLTYAATGLVVGGMAWVWSFGRRRVTRPIFTAALRGDYVVVPEHLTGERKLEFIGRY